MRHSEIPSRIMTIIYRILLPACIWTFLLLISQRLERPSYLGSLVLDWIARIWIGLGLSYVYINLSDQDKYVYWMYRMKIGYDDSLSVNWRNVVLGTIFGLMSIPFTWWAILVFLPIFTDIVLFLSVLHGLMLAIPIVVHRKKFVP